MSPVPFPASEERTSDSALLWFPRWPTLSSVTERAQTTAGGNPPSAATAKVKTLSRERLYVLYIRAEFIYDYPKSNTCNQSRCKPRSFLLPRHKTLSSRFSQGDVSDSLNDTWLTRKWVAQHSELTAAVAVVNAHKQVPASGVLTWLARSGEQSDSQRELPVTVYRRGLVPMLSRGIHLRLLPLRRVLGLVRIRARSERIKQLLFREPRSCRWRQARVRGSDSAFPSPLEIPPDARLQAESGDAPGGVTLSCFSFDSNFFEAHLYFKAPPRRWQKEYYTRTCTSNPKEPLLS